MDRSNLYLKMHKLVFGSVSLFAAENEQMLKVSVILGVHWWSSGMCVMVLVFSIEKDQKKVHSVDKDIVYIYGKHFHSLEKARDCLFWQKH